MPTAAGLPMPMSGEQGFATGFKLGDSLIQNLMNRQKMQQQADQFAQELALKKQQEARLGSMLPLQQQMARLNMQKLEMELDPAKKMAYIQQLIQGIRGMRPQQEGSPAAMGMFSGEGMPSIQELESPSTVAPSQQDVMQGFGGFSPEQQMALSMAGIKIPRPAAAASTLGKAIQDLNQAKSTGAPPEQIKLMEQYVSRLAEGAPGMSLSVDPQTGAVQFSSGGRGSQGIQQQVIDGQVISRPTAAMMTQQQKQLLTNVAREQALKHIEQPYLGFGASFNMANDLQTYLTSPPGSKKDDAADRLVKAAVSEKMVPEIAALQLSSQGIVPTVDALKHQREAIRQGWPQYGLKMAEQLPKDLQEKVVKEHNKRLKELADVRSKYFAKGMPIQLNEAVQESMDMSGMSDEELRKIAAGG